MGESLVDRPTVDKEMDEARLEVSVSFGRFENDVLSWEKWSSFSPNKYLEEVGNLSTPGSVAQKKAYFEAHYRRIAARKAVELEQEKSINPASLSLDESRNNDHVVNSLNCNEFGSSNDERLVQEVKNDNFGCSEGTDQESSVNGFTETTEEIDGAAVGLDTVGCLGFSVEEDKTESNNNVDDLERNVHQIMERPLERTKRSASLKKMNSKMYYARDVAEKATPTKKEKKVNGTKKKAQSSVIKPSPAASQSSTKKVNRSSLLKSKGFIAGESKKAPPTSLHTLGPANSSLPVTRNSLIMERMGDKDIVRRAFKTFQNCTNGSPSGENSNTQKQDTSTARGPKISTPLPHRKGNEGLKKDAAKISARTSQSGTRSNPGLCRSSSVDRKNTIANSSSISFKSDERAKDRKVFLKKLDAKPIAREAQNAQLSAKSKEDKESEIKKMRKSLNFKAKPLPSFYRDQRKPHLEKVKRRCF